MELFFFFSSFNYLCWDKQWNFAAKMGAKSSVMDMPLSNLSLTNSYDLFTCFWLDVQIIYNWNLLIKVFLMPFSLVLIFIFLRKKLSLNERMTLVAIKIKKIYITWVRKTKQILCAYLTTPTHIHMEPKRGQHTWRCTRLSSTLC
jgi:hypothetical protein